MEEYLQIGSLIFALLLLAMLALVVLIGFTKKED